MLLLVYDNNNLLLGRSSKYNFFNAYVKYVKQITIHTTFLHTILFFINLVTKKYNFHLIL